MRLAGSTILLMELFVEPFVMFKFVFFFFKQKTAYEMRISDWSSDVCSSDLFFCAVASVYPHYVTKAQKKGRTKAQVDEIIRWLTGHSQASLEIGRASCRERVCQYV